MNTCERILENGVIAIARGIYGESLIKSVEAIKRAGVRAVEVTVEQNVNDDRTYEAIRLLSKYFSDEMAIGVGTVLTTKQLQNAFDAGARYVVSPNTDEDIIKKTKKLGLISIPGAMTPSEIVNAHRCGADIVKVFPAGILGAEYFKALTAPLTHIRLAAVAGITPENIISFKKAGAAAFGISSAIFNKKLIASGDYAEIERTARVFVQLTGENIC